MGLPFAFALNCGSFQSVRCGIERSPLVTLARSRRPGQGVTIIGAERPTNGSAACIIPNRQALVYNFDASLL
jgi:hypothetical protein